MNIRTPEDFGRVVRQARKRQGTTQAELCELCGVSVTYLSELERGKTTAELGKALHVAAMLGIDIAAEERA